MVKTELDITRYLELMDLVDSLAKKKMSLLALSEKKYFELLSYRVIFENEIFFNQRQNYLEVIENYLKNQFDTKSFNHSFHQMRGQTVDQAHLFGEEIWKKRVSTISVDSRADRYTDLLGSIFDWNDRLTDEEFYDLTGKFYDISDEEHQNKIKQIFDEIKELLQEE